MTPTKFEFKLWDTKNKRFISGFKDANKLSLGCGNDPDNQEELSISFAHAPDEFLKICRFTGKKDLHEDDICDGDIIQNHRATSYCVVEWSDDDLCWMLRQYGWKACRLGAYKSNQLEIIGNINANPDMLKKK